MIPHRDKYVLKLKRNGIPCQGTNGQEKWEGSETATYGFSIEAWALELIERRQTLTDSVHITRRPINARKVWKFFCGSRLELAGSNNPAAYQDGDRADFLRLQILEEIALHCIVESARLHAPFSSGTMTSCDCAGYNMSGFTKNRVLSRLAEPGKFAIVFTWHLFFVEGPIKTLLVQFFNEALID